MSFNVTFKGEKKTYENPITVLDVVGKDKSIICAYVNNRVRELTYVLEKDSVVVPLTVKDRDAKPTYEASLRFLVVMAMNNLHPGINIRFSYNVSRAVFMQILTPGVVANNALVQELQEEMEKIVKADYPLVRNILSKEEEHIFTTSVKEITSYTISWK